MENLGYNPTVKLWRLLARIYLILIQEGYKRRSADLEEVIANQGGISSTNAQTGLGVRVSDIRRSFDEFLLNKARSATSYSETNEHFVEDVKTTRGYFSYEIQFRSYDSKFL